MKTMTTMNVYKYKNTLTRKHDLLNFRFLVNQYSQFLIYFRTVLLII